MIKYYFVNLNIYECVMIILQEEGPTIHELAHDDLLHNEASQDSVNAANFINQIPPGSNCRTVLSPSDPATAVQYHVTMEDGEDGDNGKLLI